MSAAITAVAGSRTMPPFGRALGLETIGMTKQFGGFTALDDVSIRVRPGTMHALLGENGAGKSTLVKCVMGFQPPTRGSTVIDGREVAIDSPRAAQALGVGMVYQHFTLVPSLTAAENLVIARAGGPRVIDWRRERARLDAFLAGTPFAVPLDKPVARLAAGEKQKLEILKQLYLDQRLLILDEPTSVLTPAEADEMLGLLRGMTDAGRLTVLMITHKFREVTAFCEEVSVLRRGRYAGGGLVADLARADMAAMMIGAATLPTVGQRIGEPRRTVPVLSLRGVAAPDLSGRKQVRIDALDVFPGEIVGIAGISGNGQKELVEVLAGQRARTEGQVLVAGAPYAGTRGEAQARGVRCIPEEPLRNACVPRMSVTENLAFRIFDRTAEGGRRSWLDRGFMRDHARRLIDAYGIKTASPEAEIATLSGGNVQRAVLARELAGTVRLLITANPCFGLDFAVVADIRSQIVAARNQGTAVLLISEDLDELLELSDRILVMSEGRITYETPGAVADAHVIGSHMAGH